MTNAEVASDQDPQSRHMPLDYLRALAGAAISRIRYASTIIDQEGMGIHLGPDRRELHDTGPLSVRAILNNVDHTKKP